MRRRLASALLAAAALAVLAAVPVRAAGPECNAPGHFGLCQVSLSFTDEDGSPSALQAGTHPFAQTTTIDANTEIDPVLGKTPAGQPRELRISLPPGFVGSPDATPQCSAAGFSRTITLFKNAAGETINLGGNAALPECPDSSAVGVVKARGSTGGPEVELATPIYNLSPPPGVAARLGFKVALTGSVIVDIGLKESPPYNLIATIPNVTQTKEFYGADTTLWSNPGAPSHNDERGVCGAEFELENQRTDIGDFLGITCPANIPPLPFFTLPVSCGGPLTALFEADSWQSPDAWVKKEAQTPFGVGGCDRVGFAPDIESKPTSRSASSGSGLDFNLDLQDEGLTDVDGTANSDIEKAEVTLPEGVTINPSQAEGLQTCSVEEFESEKAGSPFGAGCPAASKIGAVEAESPLLKGVVAKGSVFVATPHENLAGNSLIALYFTIKEPERGINVGLVGKVAPDPRTGQLIATVGGQAPYEIPQIPVSHFRFHFREGARSPLITPPLCGEYQTKAVFTPWANPANPLTTASTFTIDHGVGGGPCPAGGTPPFEPGFEAGSLNADAGRYSPFDMRLTRRDGDQDLTRFSAKLPPGVIGRLAGVQRCSDAQIALAKAKSGKAELASPSCPANSQIGTIEAGAGVGSQLTYVPGKLYLAGPLNGAPLSVVAIVPAVAGPFDVGDVVTREALRINPRTAEVEADGAASDPIPHILEGIPLAVRDIRANVDRPNFTLNPTSCDPSQSIAQIWGGGANPFSSADDLPVTRSARYQAANCAGLGFKPALSLKLKGGTRRGTFPALRAVVRPREGDANIASAVVRLPHSAFLEQSHFRTICTRVQYAAKACPPAAIYGHVRAFTPLLSEPLEGPVYLRSSSHNLPDLVFDLHGIVDVEAVGRIDSKAGGIRATFTEVPDAPIEKVVLNMQGGSKGLIVNSTDICAAKHRAQADLTAHNGRRASLDPVVVATGCRGKHKSSHRRRRATPRRR